MREELSSELCVCVVSSRETDAIDENAEDYDVRGIARGSDIVTNVLS